MTDGVIKGPAFPFTIDPATGGVALSTEDKKLAENVRIILGLRIGERPLNRNFGTPIRELVHEPNDGGLARLISRNARDALTQLEPRILVTDVQFTRDGGQANLLLRYTRSDRPQSDTILIPLG
jgi:phage baseplate assembly protein W